MKDNLGDRMKKYEASWDRPLVRRMPVIIRIDGKTFHTYTKVLDKPFDHDLRQAFVQTMEAVTAELSGCIGAYHQSDEVSFCITDTKTLETQGYFDYSQNKINSVVASMFTYHFNKRHTHPNNRPAYFDCRCFNVPAEDVANYFLWRQKDWIRNSINMSGRNVFSNKTIEGLSQNQVKLLLTEIGKDRHNLNIFDKYGTFLTSRKTIYGGLVDYNDVNDLLGLPYEAGDI